MAIECYLAMTAAEFQNCSSIPAQLAWMSCHFSPYTNGLSNVPEQLPARAMLILDDASPVYGHDPEIVLAQLTYAVQQLQCSCVLLDFQHPGIKEAASIAAQITQKLSCPVGVSHHYADGQSCAVLLPPVPVDVPLSEYMRPWKGRDIWLELAPDLIGYRITREGSKPFQPACLPPKGFTDESLCCHYTTELYDDHIDFTLWRTVDDLTRLAEQAKTFGISRCVGLWQELKEQ